MSDNEIPGEFVENFFGACHGGVDTLDRFYECGAKWKRGGSGWGDQEPEPGEYDFSDWDALLEEAERTGVELFPVMNYTAEWASEEPDADDSSHYPFKEEHVDDWREYVDRFVSRYIDDIQHFEIWNEPNLYHFYRVEDEEERAETYVDRVLIPAAEVIHEHGGTVVAPSATTEAWGWSLERNKEMTRKWLGYRDAYEHVDYLSVHYVKGDTDKQGMDGAENLLPYYDWVHEEYIETGKLDGIWNTEGGFTAVEAGDSGFVSLEPWERKPYPQWAPKYTIPHIHWAIEHGWEERDQFKLFWYRMGHETNQGTLDACNLLEKEGGALHRSDRARALATTRDLLSEPDSLTTRDDVRVGFGLFPIGVGKHELSPWEFTSYAFTLDDERVLVAVWLDLPGIELTKPEVSKIHGVVSDLDRGVESVHVRDYLTGEPTPVPEEDVEWADDDLRLRLPRTDDPVMYVDIALE